MTKLARGAAWGFAAGAIALAGAVALSGRPPAAAAMAFPAACSSPQPIPAGFDYPQSAATIERWVASGNEAPARAHGWNLWAALNTGSAQMPVWRSWCTATQAFGPGGTPAPAPSHAGRVGTAIGAKPLRAFKFGLGETSGEDPINFPDPPTYPVPAAVLANPAYRQCIYTDDHGQRQLRHGPTMQNNGDVMIAGVAYNAAAYAAIVARRLNRPDVLQGMRPGPSGQASIPDMPAGSIVLKPMLWPVRADGYTALPVWDSPTDDRGRYAGFEIQAMWPRAVAVSVAASPPSPASVSYLYGVRKDDKPLGPVTYARPQAVSVDRFFHSTPNLATTAACDRALLDASAYYAYGRAFRQGDRLALVAMHVMTKEAPGWTFQSFWWHDRPNDGPYAADRPRFPAGKAPGPWAQYLMASTFGYTTDGGRQWPVTFNPYIELAADHPIRTNCINCHHRAAWPPQKDGYEAKAKRLGQTVPDALEVFAQNNPIFDGLLKTDALWSIADRVADPAPRPTPTPTPRR